jgi:hypothetical protein
VRRDAYQVSISSTAGLSRQPFLLPGEHVDKRRFSSASSSSSGTSCLYYRRLVF